MGFGHDPVEDHGNGGRDDDPQGTAGNDGAQGEALVVALLKQAGVCDGPHGDQGHGAGAGNGGEHRAGQDGGDGHAAGKGAREFLHDADQALGDGALGHDAAAQQEQRDGQQDLLVDGGPHVLDDIGQDPLAPDVVDVGDGHQQDADDIDPQRQQGDDQDKQEDPGRHSGFSSGLRSGKRPKIR